ncbi:MAG TPA: MFS transporter [Planctomycetota bacterium]|nr:MFS transporter [Planctomycetota bacterium]
MTTEPAANPAIALPAAPVIRAGGSLVAYMWVAYFLNYCDRQVVFALFPVLKTELGLSDMQLGLTGSLFLWVYGIGCPIAGQIGDRYSKRLLVVLSLVIWSGVTVATGLSTTAVMLLVMRALMGLSESLYMPSAIALTANAHAPENRSRAIAALTTAQIAGVVAGSWFGGWMGDQGHWRIAFFALGALGLLYSIPYFLFLRGVREDAHVETKKSDAKLPILDLLTVPTYALLCVAFPIFVFGLWLLYGWLPNFLHEKFSFSLSDAAFNATAFVQSASLVGMLSGGSLADWLFRRTTAARMWLLATSLLFCAPCLYALGHCETLLGTRIAACGFGFFSGFMMANIFPAAFEIVPADTRASAVGVLNLFGAGISGCATLFGGMWKKTLGIEGLLTCTAAAYVFAGVALIVGIKLLFARDYARIRA